MSYQKRLDLAFDQVPILPLGGDNKYVLFSDCHRGNGTHNDNFLKNEHLYLAALRHYYRLDYTYIELDYITLVKWYMDARSSGSLYVERSCLNP